MGNAQTNWVLNLIDRITAPLRKIMGSSQDTSNAVAQVANSMDAVSDSARSLAAPMENAEQSAASIGEAITQTSTRAGALSREIGEMSRALDQYREMMATANDPEEIRAMQSVMERYERQIQDVTREMQELERTPDPTRTRQNWSAIILAANQTWELTQKVMESFDFASEIKNLESNVARYTGLTGEALDTIVGKAARIGEVFDEDANDIVRAANAMTKQMGGTFEENLNLIQSGFEKGANLNGDMLDQLTEYGPQLKAAGLDAAQGLAIMANAAKDGIFSDKALDAIKEANLSLREMGQPQVDALAAIGIQVKDLAGKTSYEAMQMISKGMKGATTQARQMVVADLFRGAGEDAGLSFIEGMDGVDLDLNKIPSVKQAGESAKGFLSDLKTTFSSMFGEIATNAQAMGGIVQMVGGLIPIVQALSRVQFIANAATRVATAAQWLWNLALSANPIGYVIIAIAALVAGIVWAWKNFQSFREVVYGVWAAIEAVFGGMGGFVGEVLEGILHLLKGVFNPANWFDDNYNFSDGLTKIAEAATKYGETVGSAFKDGIKKGGESFAEDQESRQDQEDGLSVNDTATSSGNNTLDGTYNLGGGSNGKGGKGGKGSGKDGSGLSIDGGGASSGKSITMNLEIKNYFQNVNSKLDTRKIADEIFSQVNDRLRDSLIAGA